MGTLFIVATPIGNLGDISARAARVLEQAGVIAAEDTRVTRKLLSHLSVKAKVLSYHEHSTPRSLTRLLAALEEGDVALVSDAGSPAISDPGSELVAEATRAGHDVIAVPGPSSVTAALSVSGFRADAFMFSGFLPRGTVKRQAVLAAARDRPETTVCLEAPHRIRETLEQMAGVLGDRPIAVCRELTKLHEETFRGTASGALNHFREPRGEFVIVISGGEPPSGGATDEDVSEAIDTLREEGLSGRALVDAAVAETGVSRSRVYRLELAGRRS